jgi:uncharacterized membrane protein
VKRARNWKREAAVYQQMVAALVHRIGGTIYLSNDELNTATEKGIEVATVNGNISLRVPEESESRIIRVN